MKVDTSMSGGRTVGQFVCHILEENEKAFAEGRIHDVLDDTQLRAAVYAAFPNRPRSALFKDIPKVRNRYNRGVIHCQSGPPPTLSHRYIREMRGLTPVSVYRATARGRRLPEHLTYPPEEGT